MRPRRRGTAPSGRGREKWLGFLAEVEGTKYEVRSRVTRFLAWVLGWRAACFPLSQGWGSGTGEGRERVRDVWGPEARPDKGVRSREPPAPVSPVGSLVLRPKPSAVGLAFPFPEGTGRAGTQGFSLTELGPLVLRRIPEAAKLRTSVLRGVFHCERRNRKLCLCSFRGHSVWGQRAWWARGRRGSRG